MDIEILLWFQTIRQALGDTFTAIITYLSDYFCYFAIFFAFLYYWIGNKKLAKALITSYAFSVMANQFIKITCCVYRPWVRDARVQPLELSKRGATGYSFPSNHTQTNMSINGTLAKYSKKKLYVAINVAIIIFVAISRMYLGVHTPQDVLVGLIIGFIAIFIAAKYLQVAENDPKLEKNLIILAIILSILSILYAEFKPFPVDYANGEILVDPVVMKKDSFRSIGIFVAALLGIYLENKYVNFEKPKSTAEAIKREVLGLLGVAVIYGLCHYVLTLIMPVHYARFFESFGMIIWAVYLYPYCFTVLPNKKTKSPS